MKTFILIICTCSIFSCINEYSEPIYQLEGTWKSNCLGQNKYFVEHALFLNEKYEFNYYQKRFKTNDCSQPYLTIQSPGNYSYITYSDEKDVIEGDIDFHFKQWEGYSIDTIEIDHLNKKQWCGFSDWTTKVKHKLSNCENLFTPDSLFEIFQMDKNRLRLGRMNDSIALTSINRPKEVGDLLFIKK